MDDDQLQTLLDKQAIHEVVLRYCRGVDRLDMPLVRSCYHDDGIDHHTGFTGSADSYVAWIDVGLRRFAGTMHLIGNHLSELVGEKAYAETYGTAHHWGEPLEDTALNFTSAFRYVDRFERRDGHWRISERFPCESGPAPSPADQVRAKEGEGQVACRDRSDPVYRR